MKVIAHILNMTISLALLGLIGLIFVFTIVNPPPSGAPRANSTAWSSQATFKDKAVATAIFPLMNWDIQHCGPVVFAHSKYPHSKEDINLIGFNGRWYLQK